MYPVNLHKHQPENDIRFYACRMQSFQHKDMNIESAQAFGRT